MDAHALLTAQGWRGTGHSLHPTSDSNGLTHHLLIKRNNDGRGLGSRKADHKATAWWLSAFDQALKGIDTGGSNGTMRQTLRNGALDKITARSAAKYTGARGLYASFVRGGVIEGTVGKKVVPVKKEEEEKDVKKAKQAKAPRRQREQLVTPPDSGAGTPRVDDAVKEGESKEERRARREARRLNKAEKQARKEAGERAARKVEKKKAKKAERSTKVVNEEIEDEVREETKEERKARRDVRRKRKEVKRRATASSG
ncbi:Uu.00g029600.m01.CDS01 [Anthostomella pinea]|uniref:Uu.00g029600.m01.CDS01 n=1 Tax=Anthostomella pinea TaxID=933095 RepID=A0AAI8V8M3_9PEZI|nr:Uu.00g029600.m01.CDS01 [Anthostomella pinea]